MKSTITEKSSLMVGRYGYEDSIVALGYSDGCVRVYNLNTDHKISEMETNAGKKEVTPVNCIRWRPSSESGASLNSVLLAGNTNGTLVQYVAKTGK
jgi:WD40 repeat protein